MSHINVLDIKSTYKILLSSHPLEEVHRDNAQDAIDDFIAELYDRAVGAVVVLLPSHEIHDLYGETDLLAEYRRHGLEVIHFPLENFSVPERMELFHETIVLIQDTLQKCNILIHCIAGCGRTGMMAAGVLVLNGWTAADAIDAVRHIRPGSMDVLRQILFLRGYQRYLLNLRRSV